VFNTSVLKMEDVRAAWAEAITVTENDAAESHNMRYARGEGRNAMMSNTPRRTHTDRAVEAATSAINFLQKMANSAIRQTKETPEDRRKRLGKATVEAAITQTPEAKREFLVTPTTKAYPGAETSARGHRQRMETIPEMTERHDSKKPKSNTPWGLCTAAGREKKDLHVTQGSLLATVDDSRRQKLDKHM
jgi:hypothetical protein